MPYKIQYGKHAKQAIPRIHAWYLEQSEQAAERFLLELEARLKVVAQSPEIHITVRQRRNYRKARLIKFPYQILFRVIENRRIVHIATVVHVRRNPAVWLEILR